MLIKWILYICTKKIPMKSQYDVNLIQWCEHSMNKDIYKRIGWKSFIFENEK